MSFIVGLSFIFTAYRFIIAQFPHFCKSIMQLFLLIFNESQYFKKKILYKSVEKKQKI